MSDLTKKDFLYFQNEVLQDIKKVESKLTEKIGGIYSYIQEITMTNEKRYDSINVIIKTLSQNNNEENEQKILSQIERLKRRVDDVYVNNNSRISIMQKDLSNACYKYDKIVLDNLKVNGLVGEGCPYKNLKVFIEYANKKLKELLVSKDKTNTELNLLKEKINSTITSFKTELENERIKSNDLVNQKFLQFDEKCEERNKSIGEQIKNMRMENYNYSTDLIKKTEEISIQWEKLENIKNEIYAKFDEEIGKYKKYSENLLHTFNSKKDEFDIIKSRFIEVRDLIKNVRFKKNLNQIVNANGNNENNDNRANVGRKRDIKVLTKKLNFFKKQKINKKDLEKINRNNLIKEKENEKNDSYNNEIKNQNQNINKDKNNNNKNNTNNNTNNNDIKKYIDKSKIQSTKKIINNRIIEKESEYKIKSKTNSYKKSNYFINKNKKNNQKDIDNNNINNKNDISNANTHENNEKNENNEDKNTNEINSINDTNDNFNYNIYENSNSDENENENNNEVSGNDNSYNFDIFDISTQKINNIKDYNDNENNEILIDEEKPNNYKDDTNDIKDTNDINTNKKKYTKIEIKSINNNKKYDINNNNKNINDNYVEDTSAKNKDKNINFNINKNENIINKESKVKFAKTVYNTSKTSKNNNQNIIFKKNGNKLLKSISSKEIKKQKKEINKEEDNVENSELTFTNNIKKDNLANKNKHAKYASLSEDEKTYNKNISPYISPYSDYKEKKIMDSNLENEIKNYNILPLHFDDNSALKEDKNNNINIKLIFKKINQNFNRLNFNIKEKFNTFSLETNKNFEEIKNDISQINNEINKINSINFKKFLHGKIFNFQMNNYDLFNNSGIELNMNSMKKIIKKQKYNSFFTKNKMLPKKLIEENPESPRNILNNIEPYLIKKFKQSQKII